MLWGRIGSKTGAIAGAGGHREGLGKIASALAEVYVISASRGWYALRWAGAAAFAANQRGGAARPAADARGSRAVFEEAHPALRFYAENYLPRLETMAFAVLERQRVPAPILRALAALSEAKGAARAERERLAAREMLRYERIVLAQKSAFDDARGRARSRAPSRPGQRADPRPSEVVFLASCEASDARRIVRPEGEPGPRPYRFALTIADRFDDLADDPAQSPLTLNELKALAGVDGEWLQHASGPRAELTGPGPGPPGLPADRRAFDGPRPDSPPVIIGQGQAQGGPSAILPVPAGLSHPPDPSSTPDEGPADPPSSEEPDRLRRLHEAIQKASDLADRTKLLRAQLERTERELGEVLGLVEYLRGPAPDDPESRAIPLGEPPGSEAPGIAEVPPPSPRPDSQSPLHEAHPSDPEPRPVSDRDRRQQAFDRMIDPLRQAFGDPGGRSGS
jgi:hypothetical protein